MFFSVVQHIRSSLLFAVCAIFHSSCCFLLMLRYAGCRRYGLSLKEAMIMCYTGWLCSLVELERQQILRPPECLAESFFGFGQFLSRTPTSGRFIWLRSFFSSSLNFILFFSSRHSSAVSNFLGPRSNPRRGGMVGYAALLDLRWCWKSQVAQAEALAEKWAVHS